MTGTANPARRDQIRVTACSDAVGLLTEGPRWIEDGSELMWVDILGSQLHRARIDPRGLLASPTTISIDRHVGAAAPVVGGGYLVAAGTGSCSPTPEEQSVSWRSPKPHERTSA